MTSKAACRPSDLKGSLPAGPDTPLARWTHARLLVVFWAVVMIGSCGPLQRRTDVEPVPTTPQAQMLVDRLVRLKDSVATAKGIGVLVRTAESRRETSRVVWASKPPDKLRVEILAPTGQPVAQFATDGRWLYLRPSASETVHKKSASRATLARLTGIPVHIRDITTLLTGAVPIRRFDWAVLAAEGEKSVLTLNRRGVGLVERIAVAGDEDRLQAIDMYDDKGRFSFRVSVDRYTVVDGHTMPGRLAFSDGRDNDLTITAQRWWVNAETAPDLFRLTEQ